MGGFIARGILNHLHAMTGQSAAIAEAAGTTLVCVEALQAIRGGEHDRAAEQLENDLDYALRRLADTYTPARDQYASGAEAVARAREYRAAHPRTTTPPWLAERVQAAPAIQTPSPPPP